MHKLYASGRSQLFQSVGPTKGPPVLSQLPQGFHHLYSHIEYECASPFYHHSGSARRTCLKTGKWSGRHVSCTPGEGSRGPLVVRALVMTTTLSQNKHTDILFAVFLNCLQMFSESIPDILTTLQANSKTYTQKTKFHRFPKLSRPLNQCYV